MFQIVKRFRPLSTGHKLPTYCLELNGELLTKVYVKKTDSEFDSYKLFTEAKDTVSKLVSCRVNDFPEDVELNLLWKEFEFFKFYVKVDVLHHSLLSFSNPERHGVFNLFFSIVPLLDSWKFPFSFSEYTKKYKELLEFENKLDVKFESNNFEFLKSTKLEFFTFYRFSALSIEEEISPFINLLEKCHEKTLQILSAESIQENNIVNPDYDFFISHASEDKEDFVRPFAERLNKAGIKVWYDEFQLRIGDKLRRSIDKGLANSKFGIVILSPNFFKKNWTQYELDALVQREMIGEKTILPLWHKVSKEEVMKFSPSLADTVALNTAMFTIDELVEKLSEVLK